MEAWNFADEDCGTYRDILDVAYKVTGDRRYRVKLLDLPMPGVMLLDLVKDAIKWREPTFRYSLGMLQIRNSKLRETGFEFPFGVKSALRQALAQSGSHQDL